jgi:Xaa-Pro aminopeptidase
MSPERVKDKAHHESHVAELMRERERHPRTSELPSDVSEVRPLAVDVASRIAEIDETAVRKYRLDRVREQLRRQDVAGALLSDPFNIRYATGTRNMPIWTLYAPGRYAFIATDGPVVLFEFATCQHLAQGYETIDQLRTGRSTFYFFAGSNTKEKTTQWASEIAVLAREHGGGNRRLAVDRVYPWAAAELNQLGLELVDAQEPLEQARRIKSPEEIACHRLSMDVCDVAVDRLRRTLRPGLTENQIWSILHETNIAHDGEFIDCRLLASGPRTNPWFQESGNRVVHAGELLAFDTDMIGPMGAMSDISRTYVVPGARSTPEQRELYGLAEQQIAHNVALLRPGLSLNEFADRSWPVPARFFKNRYMVLVHGVGLCDEWPAVLYGAEQRASGYDGLFEENMIVSVESYLGEEDGSEGIKLEQQVLITGSGAIPFSRMPIADALDIV